MDCLLLSMIILELPVLKMVVGLLELLLHCLTLPAQSYALIYENCRMHNGKEEFLFITYYCPHCYALNKPKNPVVHIINPLFGNLQNYQVEMLSCLNKIERESTSEKPSAATSPMVVEVREKEANVAA
ncbi:putative Lunapark domain-containing protein [Helianthus debilis subsp. tardiflorus]